MTIADLDALPLTIQLGPGTTLTFLRNEPYLSRAHISAVTDGETLYVPPHWHETHDELFRVIRGRLRVLIGKEWRDYTSEDGEICVPKGTVHSIKGFKGEETIVEEHTEPMDAEKEVFLRNMLVDGKLATNFLYVMAVSYYGDMRPGLPGHIKWLEKGLVILFGHYIAPLFGVKLGIAFSLLPLHNPSVKRLTGAAGQPPATFPDGIQCTTQLSYLETLPPTLQLGHESTMTFLRNEPYLARVHVAAITDAETLYVPPHWHETHDEFFRVIKGRLRVLIGKEWRDYTSEDGEICIPKGTVHSLKGFQGEETIFEERTEPMDAEKEIFFRNLLVDGKLPTSFLYVMTVSYHGDTRLALPGHFKWLERGLVTIFGYYIAPLFGVKVKYEGYKKLV